MAPQSPLGSQCRYKGVIKPYGLIGGSVAVGYKEDIIMADEKRTVFKHSLIMNERKDLSLTGITDVISFDEDAIYAETDKGVVVVKGYNLHVNRLNLDVGELDIEGEIYNISYEDHGAGPGSKGSFFGKLFK